MSLSPILPGRIPSSLVAGRLIGNVQQANELLARLQDQVATGQRFFLPSEEPSAAIRSIVLQKTIERKSQMRVNLNTDRSLLSVTETNLTTVSDALNQAKTFLIAGVADSATDGDRQSMAIEVNALIQGVVRAANAKHQGRYLFGGTESLKTPFETLGGGLVRYNGNDNSTNSYIDLDQLIANNVDGATAFAALTKPISKDIDPALTLATRIADLNSGRGVGLGPIAVTVDNGGPVVKTVDLTTAETIGDVKTLVENAFAPGTLTVDIDPASKNGLRLTPSAGTVAVADVAGSTVAADLGITSAAAAQITGSDIDPQVTLQTKLADFNAGAGIGTTAGKGLSINNGLISKTIDISSAVTVEDLFNLLKSNNLDLSLGINKAGTGLDISSRLSGGDFTIGENGGTNAAGLGLRTLDGSTLLADLNSGQGVPVDQIDSQGIPVPAPLEITRRDGSNISIDLQGLSTVQQVLDTVNAVDPGVLIASLNTVGNGISLVDNDGTSTGPLTVSNNQVAVALGVDGTETGTDPSVPLVGKDVNPQTSNGVISLLVRLGQALSANDSRKLERLDPLIDQEIQRFTLVRGEIGSRQKVLDDVENRLQDEDISLQQALSSEFDTDLTQAITQITQVSTVLQATLRVASQTAQLNLFSFL